MGKAVRNTNGQDNGFDFDAAFEQAQSNGTVVTTKPKVDGPKNKKAAPATDGFDFDQAFNSALKKKEEPISSTPLSDSPDQSADGLESTSTSALPLGSEGDKAIAAPTLIQRIIDRANRPGTYGISESLFNTNLSKVKQNAELKDRADAVTLKKALENPTAENIKKASEKAIASAASQKAISTGLQKSIGKEVPDFDESAFVKQKTAEFNNKFVTGEINADDIALLKQGNPLINQKNFAGVNDNVIAERINQKTSNLRQFANAASQDGNTYYFENKKLEASLEGLPFEIQTIQSSGDRVYVDPAKTKLKNLASFPVNGQILVSRDEYLKELNDKLADAKERDFFLKTDFKNNRYDPAANKQEKTLIDLISKSGEIDLTTFGIGISQDEDRYIKSYVDGYLRKINDPVINAGEGVTEKPIGQREYLDMYGRVRDYFQNVVPVKSVVDLENKRYLDAGVNKKFKPLVENLDIVNEYFGNDKTKEFESVLKSTTDANQSAIFEKYNKVLSAQPKFIELARKYAKSVQDKSMDEQTALKNLEAEMRTIPQLGAVLKEQDREIAATLKDAMRQRENRLIEGVKNADLKIYDDGTIGIKGATKEESTKFLKGYSENQQKNIALAVQNVANDRKVRADEIMEGYRKKYGGFLTSGATGLARGYGDMMESGTRWLSNNFGVTDNMRDYYTTGNKAIGEIVDNSEFAEKHFKFNGLQSLLDPSYYAYNVGQSAPYMIPAVAVGAFTGGGATGAIIAGTTGATLETVQNGLNTYNKLLTEGKDEFGLPITEYQAQKAMTDDMRGEILPNIFLQSLEFGTLLRGAKAVKPKPLSFLSKETLESAADLGKVGLLEGVQEGVQGRVQYNSEREAKGLPALDIWDYMQTDDFAQNFYGGLSGGIGFGAGAKATSLAGHNKNLKNWKKLVASGNEEFAQNSLYGYAQQAETNGTGAQYRDGLRLRIANEQYKDEAEKKEILQNLAYSAKLSKAITDLNVAPSNTVGMAAAHNLSLSELYENVAKDNEGSPLSKVYSNKSKEYLKQAEDLINGKTDNLHYVTTPDGTNVFLSKQNAEVLQQEGILDKLSNQGAIIGASENIKLKEKPVEEKEKTKSTIPASERQEFNIELEIGEEKAAQAIKDVNDFVINDLFPEATSQKDKDFAKENPLQFLKTVATQAQVPLMFKGKEISARDSVVENYGEDIVQLAESVFPNLNNKESKQDSATVNPIFDQLSQAERSKISKKSKQTAINEVAQKFGDEGKKAAFIHSNFGDIVKQLKENNKIEVKC